MLVCPSPQDPSVDPPTLALGGGVEEVRVSPDCNNPLSLALSRAYSTNLTLCPPVEVGERRV